MNLLETKNLTVKFGGLVAVNGLDLTVKEGQICALIGPNGSGKTTAINLITGIYVPTAGEVLFNGENITGLPRHKIVAKGIARTFQNIRLIGSQTVFDNIRLGKHIHTKADLVSIMLNSRATREEMRRVTEEVTEIIGFVGLEDVAFEKTRNLPYGKQRIVEIGRALATNPRLLLLDEPAAGLNTQETLELVGLIRRIRDRGITILLIEHHMELVEGLADWVFVLNYGQKIAEGTFNQIKADSRVQEAYLGKRGARVINA
ncbi:MAG: ABC transporter ATP-binding protein [Bacillota bacterium]